MPSFDVGLEQQQAFAYHFFANCSEATTHGSACAVEAVGGYAGGSATCDGSKGAYTVVPAVATPCTPGGFSNNEAIHHFTASCSGAVSHGDECALTHR